MEKMRVGLIGCGGITRHRIPQLLAVPGVEIVGLSDPSIEQTNMTKKVDARLEFVPHFNDHNEMLAAIRPHAVVIGSPHASHCRQVCESFEAGAHVLVEKPLSNTVAECRQVIEARDKSGKVGAISYQRHGQLVFQHLREIVADGRYGKILMVNSSLAQDWLRLTRGSWRQTKALSGGGQIHDSGSHMIDILLWILGTEPEVASALMHSRGSEVDINSVVNVGFANEAMASLTVIGDAPMWQERHSFWFEEAAVQYDGSSLSINERSGRKVTVEFGHGGTNPDANFIAAIRGEAEVLAPFECGLRTIALTEAAWNSAAQGGAVTRVAQV